MADPKLGTKRLCPNCGARFYDLAKTPAECPKCEHVFTPEALLKPRKPRAAEKPKEAAPKAAPIVEEESEELESEEERGRPDELVAEDPLPVEDEDEDRPEDRRPEDEVARTTGTSGPDLEEFDEDEIEGDDEDEDDALIESDEEDDPLTDVEIDDAGDKDDR